MNYGIQISIRTTYLVKILSNLDNPMYAVELIKIYKNLEIRVDRRKLLKRDLGEVEFREFENNLKEFNTDLEKEKSNCLWDLLPKSHIFS